MSDFPGIKSKGTPQTSSEDDAFGWLSNFGASTLSGFGEVFGFDPPEAVKAFRARNPGSAFTSQLVGFGVPYVGWEAAALKIPALVRAAKGVENVIGSPFLAGAAREVVKLAPFEAGRTLIGTTLGDASPGDMLKDNLLSFATAGGIGGALNTWSKAAKVLDNLEGEVDSSLPDQFILRSLLDKVIEPAPLDPVRKNAIERGIIDTTKNILNEFPSSKNFRTGKDGKSYSSPKFVYDLGDAETTRGVNRLFVSGRKVSSDDFRAAGFDPKDSVAYVQYPRVTELPKGKQGLLRQYAIVRAAKTVARDTWVTREGGDGLYVVFKRFDEQVEVPDALGLGPAKIEARPKVLMFKTDVPDRFAPTPAAWTNTQDRISAYAKDLEGMLGKSNLFDIALKTMGQASGIKGTTKIKNAITDGIWRTIEKTGVPRQLQLLGSHLGRTALMTAQATHDLAQQWAREQIYGVRVLDAKRSAVAQVTFGNFKAEGEALVDVIKAAAAENNGALPGINAVLLNQTPYQDIGALYAAGALSQKEFQALTMLHKIQEAVGQKEILPLQKLTGINKYKELQGHYGVPRTWQGDHRVSIRDETGADVFIVPGFTTGEAVGVADDLIAAAKKEGKTWVRSEPFRKDEGLEAELLAEYSNFKQTSGTNKAMSRRLYKQAVRNFAGSKNFQRRAGMAGFVTEWTPETLTEAVGKHLENKMRYAASLASRHAISQFADKMRVIGGQHVFDVVERRLRDFEGQPGPIGKATNEALDKVLGPVLGKNAATKIASTVNKVYTHLAFGAGNIAYPILNAVGFLQNVLPHIALVQNAPRAMLANHYDAVVLRARDGVQGAFALSPLKFAAASVKNLMSHDPEWLTVLNRGLNDGTTDPKFVEEFAGATASKFGAWRDNMKSPGGWAKTLGAMSSLMMESGERFSRMHAMSAGYLVARDFLKLRDPDAVYAFVKKFTDNTMYRYAVPDRPTLFAGPVGSVLGLFKNWMMHYTMWMIEHAKMGAANPTSMAAWSPLLWQVAGTGVLGGVGAWPFFALADNFSKFVSDKTIMQHTYDNLVGADGDTTLSDALYYGLPTTLGFSLSAQAEMPFSAPLRDAEFMFMPVHWHRMQAMYRAIGDSANRFTAAGHFNPLDSQKLSLEWAQALAPKTMYRALQAQTEGTIRSGRTGEPLVQGIGTMDRIGYALGLTPTEVARTYEVGAALWDDMEKRKRTVQVLGQEWKEAQALGDYKAVFSVMRRAMEMGLDVSSVMRSANARMTREEEDMLEANFRPEVLQQYRSVLPR